MLAGLLALALLRSATAGAAPPADDASAQAQATVRAVFDHLLDRAAPAPAADALVRDAWDGAAAALVRAGETEPLPRPEPPPAGRVAAWVWWQRVFPPLIERGAARLGPLELAYAASEAMVGGLGQAGTRFLPPSRAAAEAAQAGQSRPGFGLSVRTRPPWLITDVLADSPAARSGLRAGDTVLSVNGQPVSGTMLLDANGPLSERSAPVELLIERPDGSRWVSSLTPELLRPRPLDARLSPDGIGLLRLRALPRLDRASETPPLDRLLDQALAEFEQLGAWGWLLDLRDLADGDPLTADELLGRFLPAARSRQVVSADGFVGHYLAAGRPAPTQRPLAVLINGGTAGPAETLAAALQESGRALIVGERSAGVVAESLRLPLAGGAALWIATASVETARSRPLAPFGVTPDRAVVETRDAAAYADGRDPQAEAARRLLAAGPRWQARPPATASPSNGSAALARLTRLAGALEPAGPLIVSEDERARVNRFGPALDGPALAAELRRRGWQGSVAQPLSLTATPEASPLWLTLDQYATEAAARAAAAMLDAPLVWRATPPPLGVPADSTAARGQWTEAGALTLQWPVGALVVTLQQRPANALTPWADLVAAAALVDRRLRADLTP